MINEITYTIKKISMKELLKAYNPKVINGYCEQCNKYKSIWSCPPLPFKDFDFLNKYKYCYLISGKVLIASIPSSTLNLIISDSLKNYDDISVSKDANSNIFNGIYYKFRELNDNKILNLEGNFSGSTALISGRCLICKSCTRKDNLPCIHPDKLRYSLEALGLDVAFIIENILHEKMQWSSDKAPEYVTCVSALLSNEEIEESHIEELLIN